MLTQRRVVVVRLEAGPRVVQRLTSRPVEELDDSQVRAELRRLGALPPASLTATPDELAEQCRRRLREWPTTADRDAIATAWTAANDCARPEVHVLEEAALMTRPSTIERGGTDIGAPHPAPAKHRSYQCRAYRSSDGTCDAKPVDAELVDTAVMERLHDLLPDFETWIGAIEDQHTQERQRLVEIVDRAERDRDALAREVDGHERQVRLVVAAGKSEARIDLLVEFVEEARANLEAAELRVTAAHEAVATVPTHAPRDRLLDFAIDLRESIRGRTEQARSVEDVNRALVEVFESFVIWDDRLPRIEEPGCDPTLPTLPDDQGVHAGGIKIDPSLRPEVAHSLLVEHSIEGARWPKPPLEWIEIEAVCDSADAQESWHLNSGDFRSRVRLSRKGGWRPAGLRRSRHGAELHRL